MSEADPGPLLVRYEVDPAAERGLAGATGRANRYTHTEICT